MTNGRSVRRTRSDEPMISTRHHKTTHTTPQRRGVRRHQSHNSRQTAPLPALPMVHMISMPTFLSHQLHNTQPPPNLASTCSVVLNPNVNREYLQSLHEQYVQALPQHHERICQGLLNKLSWTNAQKLVVLYAQQIRMHAAPKCVQWIVQKAQQEPHYADMYAHFALELSKQLEELSLQQQQVTLNVSTALRDICWNELEQSHKTQAWLGLVRFVGASYRVNREMIPIQDYLTWLWDRIVKDNNDNELLLEGLGQLLTNSQWEEEPSIQTNAIWNMVQDLAKSGQHVVVSQPDTIIQTSKRIQFLFQDLMDLKQNRWELKPRLVQEQARTLEEIHQQIEMEEEQEEPFKTNSALSFLSWRSEPSAARKPAQHKYSNPTDCAQHMHSIIRGYLLNEEEPVDHVMELWKKSVGDGPKDDSDYQARCVAVLADCILMALEMKSPQVVRLQGLIQRLIEVDKIMTSLLLQGLQLPLELLRDVELDAPKAVQYLGQFLAGFDTISLRDLFFHSTPHTWPERPGALAIELLAAKGKSEQDDLDCIEQILEESGEPREHPSVSEWMERVKQ